MQFETRLIGLSALCAVYLVLPSRTFQTFAGVQPDSVGLFWLHALLNLFTLYLLLKAPPRKTEPPAPLPPVQKWSPATGLLLVLIPAALVVCQSVAHLNEPLDWDESDHLTDVAKRYSNRAINHHVPQAVARWGIRAWGLEPWAARLPTLVFLLGTILTAVWLGYRTGAWLAGALVFTHLAASGSACWHLHSFRGYSAMLFCCFTMFAIVWATIHEEGAKRVWPRAAFFFFVLAIGAFSHFFVPLFAGLLGVSYALWVWRGNLAEDKRRQAKQLLLGAAAALPFAAILVYDQFRRLAAKGMVGEWGGGSADSALNLFSSLGLAFSWQGKFALFFTLVLFLRRRFEPRPWNLLDDFVALSLFSFTIFPPLFGAGHALYGRFFFAFLVPLLFWWCQSVASLRSPRARVGGGIAVLTLAVLFPLQSRATMHTVESLDVSRIGHFLSQIRRNEGEVPPECYRCLGPRRFCSWSRIYLQNSYSPRTRTSYCTKDYLLVFPEPDEARPGPVPPGLIKKTPYLRYSLGGRYYWFGSAPRDSQKPQLASPLRLPAGR